MKSLVVSSSLGWAELVRSICGQTDPASCQFWGWNDYRLKPSPFYSVVVSSMEFNWLNQLITMLLQDNMKRLTGSVLAPVFIDLIDVHLGWKFALVIGQYHMIPMVITVSMVSLQCTHGICVKMMREHWSLVQGVCRVLLHKTKKEKALEA